MINVLKFNVCNGVIALKYKFQSIIYQSIYYTSTYILLDYLNNHYSDRENF